MREHRAAERRDHVAAQDDVLLDRRIAEVKVAVLEAVRLVRLAGAVDLKGQLVVAAAAQQLDLLRRDLNVTGGELGVLAGALAHDALDGDGRFLVVTLDLCEERRVLDDDLGRAVEVAKHDEGETAADLAHVLHPADEFDALADVL